MAKSSIWIDGVQAGTTLKTIKKEVAMLNREINRLPVGSKEYYDALEKLGTKNALLNEHRNKVRSVAAGFDEAKASAKGMLSQYAPLAVGIGLVTSAISGFFSAIGSGIKGVIAFDTALADLKAVTGANDAAMKQYMATANEYSAKYGESAADIVTAIKLAGSARPELLENAKAMSELTEQAIILAKASGDDVPTSIKNLTGTLNAFEKPASAAGEVMDTLANAAQLGVQEIPYLTEAFTKFGGIAEANNVTIAESAAGVELLGKKFPDAAGAGTGFRNVLLKLSATKALPKEALEILDKYGISLEGLEDKTKPFSKRLELLKPLLKDNSALVKIFGTENVLAAQTLVGQSRELGKLSSQYGKVGTAQKQAEINMATVGGALERIVEKFKNQFLGLEGGSKSLTAALDFVAKNMETILHYLGTLAKAFVIYKTSVAGASLAQKLFSDANGKMNVSLKQLISNLKSGEGGLKSLGSALKGIGWVAIISLAVELGTELYRIGSGAAQAEEDLARLQATEEKALKATSKNIEAITKRSEERLRIIQNRIASGEIKTEQEANKEKVKALGLTQKEIYLNAKQIQSRRLRYNDLLAEVKAIDKKIKKDQQEGKGVEDKFKRLREIQDELKVKGDKAYDPFAWNLKGEGEEMDASAVDLMSQLDANIKATRKSSAEYHQTLKEVNDQSEALQATNMGLAASDVVLVETSEDKEKATRKAQKAMDDYARQLAELIKQTNAFSTDFDYEERLSQYEEGLNKELYILQKNVEDKYQVEIDKARELLNVGGDIEIKANEQYNKLLLIQDEDYELQSKLIREKYAKEAQQAEYEFQKQKNLTSLEQQESYENAVIEIKVKQAQAAYNAISEKDVENRKKAYETYKQALIEQYALDKQRKIESLLDQYDQEVISQKELNLRKADAEKEYLDKVEQMNAESRDKIQLDTKAKFDAFLAEVSKALGILGQVADIAVQAVELSYKKAVKAYAKQQEEEKKILNDKLNTNQISKQQYDDRIAQMDKEAEEKKNQLQAEYGRKKKDAAKVQALINGALAITQAFAQLGPVAGAIAAALVATNTALQISAIEEADVDQFFDGGVSDKSGNHKVKGAKDGKTYRAKYLGKHKGGMLPSTSSLILASEKGPEYFVPYHLMRNQEVVNHVAAIEAIRTNQMADGGYTTPPGGGSGNSDDMMSVIMSNTAVMKLLYQMIPNMKAVVDDKNAEKIVKKAEKLDKYRG